jgi:hypothetical protein
MPSDEHKRRDVLQALATLPLMALAMQPGEAIAQTPGNAVKVDTKGLVAKINSRRRSAASSPRSTESTSYGLRSSRLLPGGRWASITMSGLASGR